MIKSKVKSQKSKVNRGFTLIDVLVGTALMLIVFLGIFGAYQLGLKVVGQSRNKIIATAIANQQIEMVRNLPYESVGVKGGFPDGVLEAATIIEINNIEYVIETRVDFVVDSADGIAPPYDDCFNDYKKVEIKVSWPGRFKGEVKFSTDIAPKNLAEECAIDGGILMVSVFDAFGVMVPFPLIEIKDPATKAIIKTATPVEGKHYFSLATSTYKVVISKKGYSSEQTFSSGDVYNGKTIITPAIPHPIVLEGQLTEMSFSIDRVSSFSVNTLSPWGTENFSDSFLNETKISELSNVVVSGGKVKLATTTGGYLPSGYLISTAIAPTNLLSWSEFSWTDLEPLGTDLKYQIYYASGTNWYLIPDIDLAGNSEGFDVSPVDLSDLTTTTYAQLKLRANFSTTDANVSPTLNDWQVSWITSEPIPIPNVSFNLRGAKKVGTDAGENPIFKYSQNHTTDGHGELTITNLEWDFYTFSVNPATGLDLIGTEPSPHPIGLAPNTNLAVKLYLDAQNSLLVTVRNVETLEPIFAASTTLSNLAYSKTQYTDEKGQTHFIPLEVATYNLDVSAPGYLATSTSILVSGDETLTIKLKLAE